MTTFTGDDVAKRVENANGEVIGTVTDVDGETARIQPRSGMVDSIKAALGWRRPREEGVTIRADAVSEITTETVRLEPTPTGDPTDVRPATGEAEGEGAGESEQRTSTEPDVAGDGPDRGVATDDSEHGLEIDDPNDELATGDTADSADGETDAVDDPIGSATPPEPEGRPDGEEGTERERDRDPGRDRQRATADDGRERRDDRSTDREPEPEPAAEDRNSSPIEPLESTDTDGDERGEAADADADAGAAEDERAPSASDSAPESDDDSIDVADATATERPNRVGEPAIDEPVTESEPENETADGGEARTKGEETRDLTDEPNVGSGTRSLEAVGGSAADGSPGEESRAESAAAEGALADEVDRGVDIESAVDDADSDATAPDADATDPAEELETGPDLEAAVESADSPADGTPEEHRDEGPDPALEIEPGIDAASAIGATESMSTAASESEAESGPAGQRTDIDTGPGTAMHRGLTDGESATELDDTDDGESDEAPEPSGERTRRPSSKRNAPDRSSADSVAITPITAAVAAQRAALATNRTAAKLGATAQRNAARTALAGPLLAQRGTLAFAQAAARSYANGVATMLGTGTTSDANRDGAGTDAERSTDEALASLEETHSRLADEDLNRELASHLERVRELQSAADEFDRRERTERAVELLERQTELLRRCQGRLEGER